MHDHEAPDLLGLWGGSYFESGVNEAYREYVIEQAKNAAVLAAQRLRPAKILLITSDFPHYVREGSVFWIAA